MLQPPRLAREPRLASQGTGAVDASLRIVESAFHPMPSLAHVSQPPRRRREGLDAGNRAPDASPRRPREPQRGRELEAARDGRAHRIEPQHDARRADHRCPRAPAHHGGQSVAAGGRIRRGGEGTCGAPACRATRAARSVPFPDLVRALERTRSDGFALDDEETERGVSCIGAANGLEEGTATGIVEVLGAGPWVALEARENVGEEGCARQIAGVEAQVGRESGSGLARARSAPGDKTAR